MGTRVLNFDNIGPSGELHVIVKELFNVLLLFLFNEKNNIYCNAVFLQLQGNAQLHM